MMNYETIDKAVVLAQFVINHNEGRDVLIIVLHKQMKISNLQNIFYL